MLRRNYLVASLFLASLALFWASTVQAAPVGTFLQVDLMKGGKLPATTVKVQDGVEVGDVVRTKSQSRAQIKFVDDTVLTIAPESRVTVEEYMFDGAKGERRAVLGVLRGLVHTAVEKVYPKAEPDFIMKTHTAVLGVRGTKWYTKLLPNATDVYTEGSKLEVRNILSEYPGVQLMGSYQYVRVGAFMNPTIAMNTTVEDLKPLSREMKFGMGPTSQTDTGPLGPSGLLGPPQLYTLFGMRSYVENINSGLYVPPRLEPRHYFMIVWSGYWDEYSNYGESNGSMNLVVVNSYGWGNNSPFFRNGFDSEFIGAFAGSESYSPFYGSFTAKATGWYKGGPAGRLVGTIQVVFSPSYMNGNGNGYATGYSPGMSLASSSPTLQAAAIEYGNGNIRQATLTGPFVFNSQEQILRAPISGPYTVPDGQRFTLRGILIQRPGE